MKRFFQMIISLLVMTVSLNCFAKTSADILQERITNIGSQQATFSQTISQNGEVLEKNNGDFKIKSPRFFLINTKGSVENTFVSDGEQLYFYDPSVMQVTLLAINDVVKNTPFGILTNQVSVDKFNITRDKDSFIIKSKDQGESGEFFITIDKNGVIKKFGNIEEGVKNEYTLHNSTKTTLDPNMFTFIIPQGVEVDDRR